MDILSPLGAGDTDFQRNIKIDNNTYVCISDIKQTDAFWNRKVLEQKGRPKWKFLKKFRLVSQKSDKRYQINRVEPAEL